MTFDLDSVALNILFYRLYLGNDKPILCTFITIFVTLDAAKIHSVHVR